MLAVLAAGACGAPAQATELIADDFERGGLAAWAVATAVDGAAETETATPLAGTASARLSSTAAKGAFATLRRTLAADQADVTVELTARVLAEGAAGGNVPLVKLLDRGGALRLSLYRQNGAAGRVYVRDGDAYRATGATLALGRTARVVLRVAAGSRVTVAVDGAPVYDEATAGTAAVATVQLGNDVKAQPFALLADDVLVRNPDADTTPPQTTITGAPSGTVASSAARVAFTAGEPGASFTCRVDDGAETPCASPHEIGRLADGPHRVAVRATDAAGNADPTPAVAEWTVLLGDACDASLPPPANEDPGQLVLADGFESGGFAAWTARREQGDATLRVQRDAVHDGRCAALLHVTTATFDSRASLVRTLPPDTEEVWLDGWFDIRSEGAAADWNAPTFRLQTRGRRVLDVSRQNGDGTLFVRWPKASGGYTVVGTGRRIALDAWQHLRIHVRARGNRSTVEVGLNGTPVYASDAVPLPVDDLELVMVGAEHQNQEGDVAVDDVVVKARVKAEPDVLLEDGFEDGDFLGWTSATTGGDGTATVQRELAAGGTAAALLTTTPNAGSFAAVKRTLAQAETDLTASVAVRAVAEGAQGATAPLLTFNDAGGVRVATVVRYNRSGDRLGITYGGQTYSTSGTLPLGAWRTLTLRTVTRGDGASLVRLSVGGVLAWERETASLNAGGVRSVVLGATGPGKGYTLAFDDVRVRRGTGGPPDPARRLLVADYLNRRLLITSLDGAVLWSMDNPTGGASYLAGPLGVRWVPGDRERILATFGTGEVGVIDVATKTWVWRTTGYGGRPFQSPYDAELLPDGRLAVALRFNDGGRVDVYDRATGERVWTEPLPDAHSVHFRTPEQSYGTEDPTLLVAGFGAIREIAYRPGLPNAVTWQVRSEFTHDAIVVEDDAVLSLEGYYVQKLARDGTQLWRRSTPDEDRRAAPNPGAAGGYVLSVGEGDRVELRDRGGNLLREWSRLSDGTVLDYPYGVQLIPEAAAGP